MNLVETYIYSFYLDTCVKAPVTVKKIATVRKQFIFIRYLLSNPSIKLIFYDICFEVVGFID